ncbi:35192_t:CDS:2 [Gigaspora margarita]|uniref:35192_t:CDS:1 n=1 Tax=Gigaspora margarita TaxID=4874 RepID=A0ABN7VF96_GIGMA|nr:35192_t:CDS:2 [Gigaspora margarita]
MESNVCHYGECIECGGANSGSNWCSKCRIAFLRHNTSGNLKINGNSQFICQEYLNNNTSKNSAQQNLE